MAHRTFVDRYGRTWDAWTVVPEFADRRRAPTASPPTKTERRTKSEFRVPLAGQWKDGWLAFATKGEKKRLASYPPNWVELSDAELEQLCDSAIHAPPQRRLTE
jgi:hypothetical protein